MSGELFSLVVILVAFSLYGLLSGIELAVALLRVEPRLAPKQPVRRVFTPRLEVTNILLVAGITGMVLFFNEAALAVAAATWPLLLFGLLAIVTRAGLLMYLFAHKLSSEVRSLNYLFAAASFAVPLAFGSAGIYMLTGELFWHSMVGITLFGANLAGLLAVGVGFIFYIGQTRAPQGVVLVSRALNLLLAGLLAIVLVGVLHGGDSHLLNLPYAYLALTSASIVLLQSVLIAANKEWHMWWCLAALALLAPCLLGLANHPYLVYPDVLISVAR